MTSTQNPGTCESSIRLRGRAGLIAWRTCSRRAVVTTQDGKHLCTSHYKATSEYTLRQAGQWVEAGDAAR